MLILYLFRSPGNCYPAYKCFRLSCCYLEKQDAQEKGTSFDPCTSVELIFTSDARNRINRSNSTYAVNPKIISISSSITKRINFFLFILLSLAPTFVYEQASKHGTWLHCTSIRAPTFASVMDILVNTEHGCTAPA